MNTDNLVVDSSSTEDEDDGDDRIVDEDMKENVKGGRQNSTATVAKNISKTALDMDAVGTYNGMQIYDVNLDSIEDKPWRKPGSDITDYFNYGFTEETWKVYCDRQRKIRAMNQNGQFDVNAALNMTQHLPTYLMANNQTINGLATINSKSMMMNDQREPLIKSIPNNNNNNNTNNNNNQSNDQQFIDNSKFSNSIMTINSQQGMKKSSLCMPPPPLPSTNLATASSLRKHTIEVLGANNATTNSTQIGQGPPQLPIVPPPPPLPGSASGLLGSRPSPTSPSSSQPNQDRLEPNSISVIGNRSNIPFPPPPLPPFAFPPVDPHVFPPSLRPPVPVPPPLGMLPPLGPNVQPPPFGSADFRPYPPPPGSGILPHPSDQRTSSYDQDYDERSHKRSRSDYDDYDVRSSRSSDRYGRSDRNERRKERSRERSRDRSSNQHESSSSTSSASHRHNRIY
ncbi:hypothetical protein HUG17_3980 [Dermatophagoides farinae]|uniref:Pre-mRNA polyadenylation factor Fip1 domain-containing protein n=1 Tax=Dermatophagoides farinae TaxID=6954 RepID=A0A9D4NXH3_DERFA|nr:hypothetical protein HUG17_3980 [Dermatophagoides farinae]